MKGKKMSIVHPFKGLRPKKELVKQVASLPYDVMNSKEARQMAEGNEYSFLRVVRPEINLQEGIDLYDDSVYKAGADSLREFVQKKVLIREKKKAFYIYKQKMGDHEQFGLVIGASAQEYEDDLIKKHEFTRAVKEEDRVKHVIAHNGNAGPVFLAYRAQKKIDALINELVKNDPVYDFVSDDGIGHTLWVVDDKEKIVEIKKEFKNVPCLYVADGHHRTASGYRVAKYKEGLNPCHTGKEEYNYFLAVIFPHNQLKIMDYNRVVKDLNGLSSDQFIEKIKEKFSCEKISAEKPENQRDFSMYIDKTWYCIKPLEGTFPEKDPVESLDVSILQNNLLSPVLGIEDPRRDDRIDFVGGIRGIEGLEKRVDEGGWKVAFALYPTSMDELMSIADAGKTMPPKSTWFEPKLRSGIIVHSLD
jgi:uncharacterized protein (DUF1015 family)